MEDQYIVIEVPHQNPARATVWRDEAEALQGFTERAAESEGPFDSFVRDNYADDWNPLDRCEYERIPEEVIWAWAEHDLHALHRWTLEEAREKLAWLDTPNGGQQKIHQQAAVVASLARFVEGWDD